MGWTTFFAGVPNFRLNRRKRHLLLDILAINLLAVICGADDCEEIALCGRQREPLLRTFLSVWEHRLVLGQKKWPPKAMRRPPFQIYSGVD